MFSEYHPSARQPIGSVNEIRRVLRAKSGGTLPRNRHENRVTRRRAIRRYGREIVLGVALLGVALGLLAWNDSLVEDAEMHKRQEIDACLARGGVPYAQVDEAGDTVIFCNPYIGAGR